MPFHTLFVACIPQIISHLCCNFRFPPPSAHHSQLQLVVWILDRRIWKGTQRPCEIGPSPKVVLSVWHFLLCIAKAGSLNATLRSPMQTYRSTTCWALRPMDKEMTFQVTKDIQVASMLSYTRIRNTPKSSRWTVRSLSPLGTAIVSTWVDAVANSCCQSQPQC